MENRSIPKFLKAAHAEDIDLFSHSKVTPQERQLSRTQLEMLACGKVSPILGSQFINIDHYSRIVRLPTPPMLLIDRVTSIDAEPLSLGNGTITTETLVKKDSWYSHLQHMSLGAFLEAGQADLLLISWLGIDKLNQGERVYRLLGCELELLGDLPQAGELLKYEITIDKHIKFGTTRLFFFHFNCYINDVLRLAVRNGQAGFFTDQELAQSEGVQWSADSAVYKENPMMALPEITYKQKSFTRQQLEAWLKGDAVNCFGQDFAFMATHTRTPTISSKQNFLIHEIDSFDVDGGPAQRGYMRGWQAIKNTDWFFQGHFKDDPCMPGSVMLDAAIQCLAVYMGAIGLTIKHDGWRFAVKSQQVYRLQCRGQVIPSSNKICYEVFVDEVVYDPMPSVSAYLLVTADGLKAFHTYITLSLVPDWPIAREVITQNTNTHMNRDSFLYDEKSLLAAALGAPSKGFGPGFLKFDKGMRIARLPAQPYHFISRINSIAGPQHREAINTELEVEYDIPDTAWYFSATGSMQMPFCVLLETVLQPCGWLANYMLNTSMVTQELLFRNLEGSARIYATITPRNKVLRTSIKATQFSRAAGIIIVSFQAESYVDNRLVFHGETTFGYFPVTAFIKQIGLPTTDEQRNTLKRPSSFNIVLPQQAADLFLGSARLPERQLLMIDAITGYWENAGIKQMGLLRAEKSIDSQDWFFKAHFFQDPVQPGSLGIEAFLQMLKFYALQLKLHEKISNPIFQSVAHNYEIKWKYRGQVTPSNSKIQFTLDITKVEQLGSECLIAGVGSLWVDGKRIYEINSIAIRIIGVVND